MYKRKLGEYKKFEVERCKNFKDFYYKIKEQVANLHQSVITQIVEMTKNTKQNIVPYIRCNLNDRYEVIDTMLSSIIQCAIPVSHRYLMYLALKGSEIASEVRGFMNGTSCEDFDKVTAQLKMDANELMKMDNFGTVLKGKTLRIQSTVNKLLDNGKELQSQIISFDQYIFNKLMPSVRLNVLTNFINWVNFVFLYNSS